MTCLQKPTLIAFAAGMLGALFIQLLFSPAIAQAARDGVNYFLVSAPDGRKAVETFVNDGQPGLFLYGEDSRVRLQLGTYNGSGERGLPIIGLSDNANRLRMLFRLAGSDEAPVIIMKDANGRDRLVMGLALGGSGTPFLSIVDEKGQKKDIFGTY